MPWMRELKCGICREVPRILTQGLFLTENSRRWLYVLRFHLPKKLRFFDFHRISCGQCPLVWPERLCCFMTVRAATSLARPPYRPDRWADSLICSYIRCSLLPTPRICFEPGILSLLLQDPTRARMNGPGHPRVSLSSLLSV